MSEELEGHKSTLQMQQAKVDESENYIKSMKHYIANDYTTFAENKIKLGFLNVNLFRYDQGHKNFIPGLSVIDYLCHCGPKTWSSNNDNF